MTGAESAKTNARRRGKLIELWMDDQEKAEIAARAE